MRRKIPETLITLWSTLRLCRLPGSSWYIRRSRNPSSFRTTLGTTLAIPPQFGWPTPTKPLMPKTLPNKTMTIFNCSKTRESEFRKFFKSKSTGVTDCTSSATSRERVAASISPTTATWSPTWTRSTRFWRQTTASLAMLTVLIGQKEKHRNRRRKCPLDRSSRNLPSWRTRATVSGRISMYQRVWAASIIIPMTWCKHKHCN